MPNTILLTGATGFVGSHVAEVLVARGDAVRALVREGSDTTFLSSLGVEIIRGDATDVAALACAIEGCTAVVNCAAKVGDWGPVSEYRAVNVEGLRALLDAARGAAISRFVHVSSLGVYAARHHYATDETEPLPADHADGYTQSKVEAERLALEHYRKHGTPVTILRPGFVYGPRDRTVLPRLVARLKEKSIVYIAGGRFALNTTFAANIADAVQLALDAPAEVVVGEVFNITDGEFVSKRRFFELVADGLELKRPRVSIPLWLARPLAGWRERVFRRRNSPTPPRITQAQLKFAGYNLDFSIAKARIRLGYAPKVLFDEGMARALAWYKSQGTSSG